MRKLKSRRRGASAVEFAMLLPVFLLIAFGVVVAGSCLAVVHGVQLLAAEAVRSSIAGLIETERDSIASDITSQTRKTVNITNFTSSLTGSLLGDFKISVLGLGLAIPGLGGLVTSIISGQPAQSINCRRQRWPVSASELDRPIYGYPAFAVTAQCW